MTDRELRRLSRAELLELLLAEMEENEDLRRRLQEAEQKLADRALIMNKAGSMAEASLQLNDVFKAADASARQYLENVQRVGREYLAEVQRAGQKYLDEVRAAAAKGQ